MRDETALRAAVVDAARRLEAAGHSPGSSGNLSVRLARGTTGRAEHLLVTPSGVEPAALDPAELVVTTLDGAVVEGRLAPSSELPFHGAIYRRRPDVGAVVHTHSRYATILACTRRGIPAMHYMVAATGRHEIPCSPYATPGSRALSEAVLGTLGDAMACLLANHGQIAVGPDLESALRTAELVERLAETHWGALAIGGEHTLRDAEMREVLATYGERFRRESGGGPSHEGET